MHFFHHDFSDTCFMVKLKPAPKGNASCLPMSDTILHGISTVHRVIWVKPCSTILWPLHWPVTSGIKGEREGKLAIKSETLTVNFVLFLFSPPCTHTLSHLAHTQAQRYTQSTSLARGHGPPQAKEWARMHNFKSHYRTEISLLPKVSFAKIHAETQSIISLWKSKESRGMNDFLL